LKTNLRILHSAADTAEVKVSRGRPPKSGPSQANKITRIVAQHYRALTGKKPTRYDAAFVELLGTTYEILGMKGKAKGQAAALPPE
jgi:hypothetical protein